MKWGNLSGLFFIIHPSTLLPAADLEAFAKQWFSAKRSVEKLQGVVNPVAKKWQAEGGDDRVDDKSKARDFVKLYSFLIEDLNTRSGETGSVCNCLTKLLYLSGSLNLSAS